MRSLVFQNCFIVLCFVPVIKASASYEGHQLWKVLPNEHKDLKAIKGLHQAKILEISDSTLLEPSIIRVPKESISFVRNFLSERRVPFEVTVDNLEKHINHQRRHKRFLVENLENFTYHEYHRFEEIERWEDLVTQQYAFVKKEQIGVTYEGRPIQVLKIRKGEENTEKPAIYLDALTHAREWISTASLVYAVNEMLSKEENQWMTDAIDWYIVPMVNIDGYVYTWSKDRLWRKTRSETVTRQYSKCHGVDGNRNWDNHWSESSASSPCDNVYHGPFAASESEVRHVMNFITTFKNQIKGLITIHSFSQLVLFPYGINKLVSKDVDEQRIVGKKIAEAIYGVHQTDYKVASGYEGLKYEWSGDTMDWSYENAGIKLSYTIELRDKGRYGFVLPENQIIPAGQELFNGIKAFARYIKDNN